MNGEVTLNEALEKLRQIEAEHRARADLAKFQQEQLLSIMETLSIDSATDADPTTLAQPRRASQPLPDLEGVTVDFTGTNNLSEKVLRVAQAADGRVLNVTVVTRLLLDTGQYKSTVRNMRSNVYRVFVEQPDVYVQVGKGNFLYRDDAPKELFFGYLGGCDDAMTLPEMHVA